MAQGLGGDAARKWQGLMQAWRRNGCSQSEFCRRQGVPLSTFNYWKRRLERSGHASAGTADATATTDFVPVRVLSSPAAGTQCVEVRLRNGRRLRCAADLPEELLRRLAAALEADGAPC
jgi:transposase-like protein